MEIIRYTDTQPDAALGQSDLCNDFSASLGVVQTLPTRAQTASLTSGNMYEIDCDTTSTPGSNYELLPLLWVFFSFLNEQGGNKECL